MAVRAYEKGNSTRDGDAAQSERNIGRIGGASQARTIWRRRRPVFVGSIASRQVLELPLTVRAGKMREMGLGPASGRTAISLADARRRARDLYDMHKAGRDPLKERAVGRVLQAAEATKLVAFSEAAEHYIAAHSAGWHNARHAAQWSTTLREYAGPIIGLLPVQEVDTGLVLKVLEPIWDELRRSPRAWCGRASKLFSIGPRRAAIGRAKIRRAGVVISRTCCRHVCTRCGITPPSPTIRLAPFWPSFAGIAASGRSPWNSSF